MSKHLLQLLVLFSMTSCIDTIMIEKMPVNKILVVNSLITPDSLFACTVSNVFAINDTSEHWISNATINVYENETGMLVCNLLHTTAGDYKAQSAKPVVGKPYRIEVAADGYPSVTGVATVPPKQEAEAVFAVPDAGYEAYRNSDFGELHFTIHDDFAEQNYYEASFSNIGFSNIDYMTGEFHDTILPDSIFFIDDFWDFSWFTIVDPVLRAEGLMRFGPTSIIATDNLFTQSSHSFTVRSLSGYNDAMYFRLFSLSPELYKFRTSLLQHKYEMGVKGFSQFEDLAGLDLSSKAIDVFSNLKGGYGIFAGYNCHVLYSKLKKITEPTRDSDGNYITEPKHPIYIDQPINPYRP